MCHIVQLCIGQAKSPHPVIRPRQVGYMLGGRKRMTWPQSCHCDKKNKYIAESHNVLLEYKLAVSGRWNFVSTCSTKVLCKFHEEIIPRPGKDFVPVAGR